MRCETDSEKALFYKTVSFELLPMSHRLVSIMTFMYSPILRNVMLQTLLASIPAGASCFRIVNLYRLTET